jgi:predicted O-linked N-acetylglucosamine transferase (SPINDLY family)
VTLLDRRYRHPATRARVKALLAAAGVAVDAVIAPEGHGAYLDALSRFAVMVDTRPYGAGLTAVEAMALGLDVLSPGPAGRLFSERHQYSHARTRGRNPALGGALVRLVTELAAQGRPPAASPQ